MTLRETMACLHADCARFNAMCDGAPPLTRMRRLSILLRPEVMTLALYRASHYFHERNWRRIAHALYCANLVLTGADIDPASVIGAGCLIVHTVGMVIRGTVGRNVTLYARIVIEGDRLPNSSGPGPVIGDDVVVSAEVTILGPIHIADRVAIRPFSLIDSSIDSPGCTVSRELGTPEMVIWKTEASTNEPQDAPDDSETAHQEVQL